jgi:hypothetical protein
MVMMLVVLCVQFRVPERCVKESTEKTYSIIYFFIGSYGAMHGIMRSDKQPGVQVHLH